MQKAYTNAVLGGLGLVGFLGSAVVRILEALGLVETAIWLHGLTDQASGFGINWTAISFDLFCVCAIGLIAINWESWKKAIAKQRAAKKPDQVSAGKIVSWISHWSPLGDSWPQEAKEQSALTITAHISDGGSNSVNGPESSLDSLIQKTAESIYGNTQPYHYVQYLATRGRPQEALARYKTLAVIGHLNDRGWGYQHYYLMPEMRGAGLISNRVARCGIGVVRKRVNVAASRPASKHA